ncbi:regulator of G-protein signaling 7 [Stomoxys calcitrans]|uniref:regulator of G-protein signaling 7 n=1 Tax=Stomoxys calcitrans TaxID=35570 RepID=UPI0027E21809|nr:regulator of G-protein signaling 7 [Stomoxys calcitrans]XP_013101104.2 regulator of G-protein signaling 7 [Stomoxys calcitrans]XP_013101105.2 regulator of G-protein signaling 7 [Stomoxys calcitrans]XP_013101106.2 regulator of G-protein signaling 7 [Stomoxys calcitrans]XP_059223920.1 regulator of G-protein signaling 7 [Stomoxys calcitrans]
MVTMSTEVDKTQTTIATAMAPKVQNSSPATTTITTTSSETTNMNALNLNNGNVEAVSEACNNKPLAPESQPSPKSSPTKAASEKTATENSELVTTTGASMGKDCGDAKAQDIKLSDNGKKEAQKEVTIKTTATNTTTLSATAISSTTTTTTTNYNNNNNNNDNNKSSKLETVTVTAVQIATTTTTATTATATTTITPPTITLNTATPTTTPMPTPTNSATTNNSGICPTTSSTHAAATNSKSSANSTHSSAQQQTLLPSSVQVNKMNANAPSSSSASSSASQSNLHASGSHQRNNHHQQSQHAGGQQPGSGNHSKNKNEDAPNILVYKKMEAIVEKMQAESTGVSVRTVKGFMTKVPSVFTGADLISWILKNLDVEDVTEALHFAHLLASHGYIFPIDDHQLTVKNDGTFYRFQTPYFWPSNCWEPENTDYAVYLCKRTMQNKTRLELADYEAENLAKLQKMFSRKWEFIFMQAESQSKVAKKRDKLERKVLDSQERAFWDVHRPMPGCVNTTEIDIKKAYRRGASSHGTGSGGASVAKNPIELLTRIITLRKQKMERRTIKVSKAAEALVSYYEQYNEFDYFITSPELPNPWQTDSTEMWDAEKNCKEVSMRRCKRWAFSMRELLKDPMGREQFAKFLEKEYSCENLLFWESVQEMKALPQSEIKETIQRIWQEFLAPDAPRAVNVDSKSVELAREAVNSPNGPNRWCFDVAASHVYHLMERDSYPRYLRSDMYKDYINCSRKKIKSIPNLFGVKR